jgi:hypothetical protein
MQGFESWLLLGTGVSSKVYVSSTVRNAHYKRLSSARANDISAKTGPIALKSGASLHPGRANSSHIIIGMGHSQPADR